MSATGIANSIGDATRRVAGTSRHAFACRAGYAAHGVVYLVVGILAVDAAVSGGAREVEGEHEAIFRLGQGAFGTVMLTLLGLGLLGYSYMRFWQAVANPERHGNDPRGIGARVGRTASGIAAAGLCLYALSLGYGWFGGGMPGAGGGDSGAADVTARVMALPGGRWLVGAIGAGVCIGAFAQLAGAVKASFLRELAISGKQERWVKPLGRTAYAARFVVLMIVGVFLLVAAYRSVPAEARGLGGALRTLLRQPYGPWLLGLTGAGLVAFAGLRGVYARYAILPARG